MSYCVFMNKTKKEGNREMGRKKGSKYISENLINLKDRTEEERKRISQMGVEARRKNKEQKMALQNCMRQLLEMKTNSDKKKQVLRAFGFSDEEFTNKSLLMVALFQKGLTGDVPAIKEITDMMDKLDMFEETKKVTNNITINLVSKGESYKPNEADEQDIWDVENDNDLFGEGEEEWETDVYRGQ